MKGGEKVSRKCVGSPTKFVEGKDTEKGAKNCANPKWRDLVAKAIYIDVVEPSRSIRIRSDSRSTTKAVLKSSPARHRPWLGDEVS
jgi:hypothetical protein